MEKTLYEYMKDENIEYEDVINHMQDYLKFNGFNNTYGAFTYDELCDIFGGENEILSVMNKEENIDKGEYSYILAAHLILTMRSKEEQDEFLINNILEDFLEDEHCKAELTSEMEYELDKLDMVENAINTYNNGETNTYSMIR